ncbi:DUF2237 family protein [Maribacter sp. 2307ULW6-5]|uniref:DUF2237 family protein n=1 Tax=Maribacter sp. 2307ULW6-5 TaxID=3386275 RepID=UPI0039BD05E4
MERNVLGTELQECCQNPKTGFYRDGFCRTGNEDVGTHVVCSIMTEEFLVYTKAQGNDLSTPLPMYQFPGLRPGDHWCLCASRWKQAYLAGKAPEVVLEATHEKALDYVDFQWLLEHKHTPAKG